MMLLTYARINNFPYTDSRIFIITADEKLPKLKESEGDRHEQQIIITTSP